MLTQSIKQHKKWLVAAAILLTVGDVFVARTAFAKIVSNTIDPIARVGANGRHLIVTGPVRTDMVQPVFLHVTVTQRSTGAIAEGVATFTGTGNDQQWEVHAFARGRETFAEGPATAVAFARSATSHGEFDDSHQWLVNVTLVGE